MAELRFVHIGVSSEIKVTGPDRERIAPIVAGSRLSFVVDEIRKTRVGEDYVTFEITGTIIEVIAP